MGQPTKQTCTNNDCGEPMFVLRGAWVCSKCDLIENPEIPEETVDRPDSVD